MYRVVLTEAAQKQLKKLDRNTAKLLIAWMRKHLDGCSDPRIHGKGLTANRSGQWRYRVGDYRLLAEIQDEQLTLPIAKSRGFLLLPLLHCNTLRYLMSYTVSTS